MDILNTQESLNTQTNAKENQNNSQLISKEQIEKTPFEIITSEEGSFLAIGHYRLTETTSKENIMQHLLTNQWDIIINLINATIHAQKREESKAYLPEIGA